MLDAEGGAISESFSLVGESELFEDRLLVEADAILPDLVVRDVVFGHLRNFDLSPGRWDTIELALVCHREGRVVHHQVVVRDYVVNYHVEVGESRQ